MSSLFPRFSARYLVTGRDPSIPGAQVAMNARGYREFMDQYAGVTFNRGLYRVHALDHRAKWDELIAEAFPDHAGTFSTFAYDWMGRQFALDRRRTEDAEPLVLLFDPGFGEALEIPATFLAFHEQELVEHADAALADTVFEEWLRTGHPAPDPTQCVGYKVWPFLGGKDQLENNEISDMEVYWSLSAQIIAQTRHIEAGTSIESARLDDPNRGSRH